MREFAKRLGGLSAAFLSDIELGRRHPSDNVLTHMARVLGTSVADLRQYDTRAPMQELKRLASTNPAYGVLFRKVLDKKVDPEEVIKFLDKHRSERGKKE